MANGKFNLNELWGALIIMGVGFLVVFSVSVGLGRWNDKPQIIIPEDVLPPKITCPSDLSSSTNIEKRLSVIENKSSNGNGGILKGYKITLHRTGLTNDIACGYLIYQASFGGKPIEQDYMSLFMRPTNSQLGGHIWPDENRGAIIQNTNNKTQIIMPLDTITYDDIAKQPIKQANWASLLNVSDIIEFQVALSAAVPNGNLDLVQIAYKCVNKDTGKEDTQCLLEIIKTEPFDE